MHDIFSPEPDPLDGLLAPPSLPSENEKLRRMVYAQTRRVLRRRHLVRQFAYAAAVAASFILGFLVLRATTRPAPTDVGEQEVSTPGSSQHPSPDAPHSPLPVADSALAREWRALDSDDQRAQLYRQAGDRYMTEENDPQSALRCYSNALDSGTQQDLTITADDNWLLMAIKDARQKESDHAKNGG
jgi:hypothetical protein